MAGAAPNGRVLVLGSDTRSFLAVIRSLGRQGLRVHVAWCPPGVPSLRSRYVEAVHALPPALPGQDAWKAALAALLREHAYDLVVPCDDQVLIPLQMHRRDFEPLARIYLLEDRAFEVTADKRLTYELAESLGIPQPRAVHVTAAEQIADALGAFEYPVAVKPRRSFSADALSERNWVTKAYAPQALRERLEALVPRVEVMVQENFVGRGVGVELLAERGELRVVFQHERVHEPLHGGGSSYRVSAEPDPELVDAAAKLMRALDYTGVAMVEFKLDRSARRFVLIEINGRFWGSLPLAVAAGADFPWYLYRMLVHGEREFPRDYRRGLYCRNLKSDLRWNWLNLRADRSDPTLATRPLGSVLAELGHLASGRERFDTLTLDDPRPALKEAGQLLRDLGRAAAGRVGAAARALPALRARRRHGARRAAGDASSLLFVCLGNICRSPFAAERARALLPEGVRVESGGTYPVPGRRSPAEAVRVAREFGVDLEPHRSRVVDADAIARADLVLVFDAENRRELLQRFPGARGKLHALGVLVPDGPERIADPYGGDVGRFRVIYAEIDRALRELAALEPGSG